MAKKTVVHAGPAELAATEAAAVTTAVVATKGKEDAPTTDELLALFTQQAGVINAQSVTIQQLNGVVTALQNAIPGQITNALTTYTSSIVAPLVQQQGATAAALTTLTTTVGTKAAATDLTALVATVGTKAASADLTTLTTTVAGKAAAADVTSLQNLVSTNTANIASNTTALAGKALASDVTALSTVVGTKAAQADLASLTTTVAGKAASSTVAALAGVVDTKASTADLTALTTTVAGKALASDLATTNTNVAANAAALALRATVASVDTQKSRVDTLVTTTVPALTTDINKRVLREGDQMTGQLRALSPATNDAPLLRGQVVNGLERQARDFFNVQATPVPATMPSMNGAPVDAQVVDSLGAGRVYQITNIQLKTLTAPLLATTITLTTTDGRSIYSRVVALTAVPAVGNVLNVLGISGQPLPTDVVLPATFQVASSQGKFEVTLDGRLKPATPA